MEEQVNSENFQEQYDIIVQKLKEKYRAELILAYESGYEKGVQDTIEKYNIIEE